MTHRTRRSPWVLVTVLVVTLCGCAPRLGASDDDDTSGTTALDVGPMPDEFAALFPSAFTQYASVFGVHVFATTTTPEDKVVHAVHVLAQYLDNDEDGEVDNTQVLQEMIGGDQPAGMILAANDNELEESGIFDSDALDGFGLQDLYGQEIHPGGSSLQNGFDATLEEVLHLVTARGYSPAYPDALGEQGGSLLADAMDLARGGYFDSVPSNYPDEAWYHYDDSTCDYGCMATEYIYWALTSMLDAQSYPGRCDEIASEWEPCTRALVEDRDPAVFALLSDSAYGLPTVLPDGSYTP